MDLKTCARCNVDKGQECFAVRKDTRRKNTCVYINNVCKACVNELQMIKYHNRKSEPGFMEAKRNNAKQVYYRGVEKIKIKRKIRRDSIEYKNWLKDYYRLNWDKIRLQPSRRNGKYIKKQRWLISDKYAVIQITNTKYNIKKEHVTPQMIEAKKISIALYRLKKRIRNYEK
jgi:hypothetical protein